MKKNILFNFEVDKENNHIKVERSFAASKDLVWSAWTESDILDKWWAPKPWVARTKSMDFREGGCWLYAMVSPENEEHWCRVDYIKIQPKDFYSANDRFCDKDGNPNKDLPPTMWENTFMDFEANTKVKIVLTFQSLKDLETILSMGFKEGFASGLENLDEYIELRNDEDKNI